LCESHLSKHGLYPTLSSKKTKEEVNFLINFVSLCDGKSSLLEIAEILNVPIWSLYNIVDKLEKINLIRINK